MASLIESLLNDPVRRLDNKRIDIVRRPMPTRQRDMLELLAALGPNASMEALRRGIDMRNADPRTTFFAVLGRWPSQAELEALGPTYETWPHLRRLLISEEFRAPIVRRVLDAYAEKRRLLFIRNDVNPEKRIGGFPRSRLSVRFTRHGNPGRTSIVRQLRIVLDQTIEQRLHIALIGRRLKWPWLPLDRKHRDGQRLLHQMQVTSREFRHAACLNHHVDS